MKHYLARAAEQACPSLLSGRRIEKSFSRKKTEISLAKTLGIREVDFEALKEKTQNKGGIFFILGSGASITELTEKHCAFMKRNVTIGINRWFLHPLNTDFYMFEGFSSSNKASFLRYWFEESIVRYAEESDSIFLLKNVASGFSCWDEFSARYKERSFAVSGVSVPGRVESSFRYNLLRILKECEPPPLLFKRGSVSLAVSLAARLGFDEVVLCGVDMNDDRYFWEDPEFKVRPNYSKPNLQKKSVHGTVDSSVNPVTLDKVLVEFGRNLFCGGAAVSVGSQTSRLSSFFPVFNWDAYL